MKNPLLLALALSSPILPAAPIRVDSPDGRNVLTLDAGDDGLVTYAIASGGRQLVEPTPISITIDGTRHPSAKPELRRREHREQVVPVVPTHASSFADAFNEAVLDFGDGLLLSARAFDDGVAFRWELRGGPENVTIDNEELTIRLASDFPVWFPEPKGEGFFTHQECRFERVPASGLDPDRRPGPAPLLVDAGDDRWMLVSDVNVEGYPGLWFEGSGTRNIATTFPPYPLATTLEGDRSEQVTEAAPYLARTTGTRSLPWRAFVLSDAAGLLTSTMLHNLADPSRIDDPSWIRPGKVAWDWWNANNLHGVPFRAGINQQTYRHYIDFAAELGLPYVILDEGWSVPGPERLLEVVPELDLWDLVEHARSKNVRLILWMTSVALERNFDEAFEQFEQWGIAGIKVDFMQRDDQPMMDFLYRTAEAAAERELLVDFHGGSKPTGLSRTWPNVLTFESVLGLEQNKWGEDASPPMATLLPFTRMVVGPMDYTPGAMVNLQRRTFQPMFETPASQGTRAQQLAMYVVYLSPLQMLADTPTNYRRNPECLPFLRDVPVTWDETVVLGAEVGRWLAVARRKGDEWWIGALSDWDARDVALPLGFLGEGPHTITRWSDGPNADRNGNDLAVTEDELEPGKPLRIHLAPGGGFAAVIRPLR